jgi:hypothetical protein
MRSRFQISQRSVLPGFLLVVSFTAAAFVVSRGQDRNWDLLNYHFFGGYSLLTGRAKDIAPAGIPSFLNPLPPALTYAVTTSFPFPFSGLLLLAVQLLGVPALFLISGEIAKGMGYRRVGVAQALALILCLASPMWWSELGTSFFSSSTASLVLWSVYFIVREKSDEKPWRFGLEIGGALMGLSVGLKLTNGMFAVAGAVALLDSWPTRGCGRATFRLARFVAGGLLGFAAVAWWHWQLWSDWGSPLFPFYNAVFRSPYADFANWRDLRWNFSPKSDLLSFLVRVAFGSSQTAEKPFADPRFLIASSLVVGSMFRPDTPRDSRGRALYLFVVVSLGLWALLFAYQRYLIPVELLLGLSIWQLLNRLIDNERVRTSALAAAVVVSATAVLYVGVPDWGHWRRSVTTDNPFAVSLPPGIATSPAQYVLGTPPIAYLLPSLDPASVFYGVGTTPQLDREIRRRITSDSSLPLRFIGRASDGRYLLQQAKALGFDPAHSALDCSYFYSAVGRNMVCGIDTSMGSASMSLPLDVNFRLRDPWSPEGVFWAAGLAKSRNGGRWNGASIEIGFARCLPRATLSVGLEVAARHQEQLAVTIGSAARKFSIDSSGVHATAEIDNAESCATQMNLHLLEEVDTPTGYWIGVFSRSRRPRSPVLLKQLRMAVIQIPSGVGVRHAR